MTIDMANSDTEIIASNYKLGATVKDGVYSTAGMSQQAAYAGAYNVVGAINTDQRFGSAEPMGILVINGEVIHDELSPNNYFVITEDGTVEIRSGDTPLNGPEYQVVGCFAQWIVKDICYFF